MKRQILGRLTEIRQWRNPSCSPIRFGETESTELNERSPTTNTASAPVDDQGTASNFEYLDDMNVEVAIDPNKPKRPFLKKGCGLSRYNMKREDYVIHNNKSVRRSKKATTTAKPKYTPPSDKPKNTPPSDKPKIDQKKFTTTPKRGKPTNKYRKPQPVLSESLKTELHPVEPEIEIKVDPPLIETNVDPLSILRLSSDESSDVVSELEELLWTIEPEPLCLPNVAMNYEGKWFERSVDSSNLEASHDDKVPVQSFWKDELIHSAEQIDMLPNNTNNQNQDVLNTSVNELRAFESLERRVDQSGFCSKDTSILQLLDGHVNQEDPFSTTGNSINDEYLKLWREDLPAVLKPYREQMVYSKEDYSETASSTDNAEPSSSNSDTTDDEESITSDTSDYSRKDKECLEVSQSIQRRSSDVPDYCDICGATIAAKLDEYTREMNDLTSAKTNLDDVKDKMETQILEFEKEVKIKRLEMEAMKASLREKQLNSGQSSNKESKALQIELAKGKQELASLKIELKETKDYIKVRESNIAVRIAKMRNTIKELEKQNANLKSEIAILTAEKNKVASREQQAVKSVQMNILRKVANDVTDLKKTTKILQLEANSKGAVKKITSNHSEKRKEKKNNTSKVLPEKEIKGATDMDADNKFPQRKLTKFTQITHDSMVEEMDEKQNVPSPNQVEERLKNDPDVNNDPRNDAKGLEDNYLKGTIRKTMFFRRGDDPTVIEAGGISKNPEDDAIIQDILEEIIETFAYGNRVADTQQEKNYDDGTKEIRYTNGNIKITTSQYIVRYYYALRDTWQTHKPDGVEILEFPSGQRDERITKKIFHIEYRDDLLKMKYFDYTVVQYLDGTFLRRNDVTGNCVLYMLNGDKEIHGPDYKSRIYSDGTVKTVFVSGLQETRYPNGRVRVKSKTGDLILDTFEDRQ